MILMTLEAPVPLVGLSTTDDGSFALVEVSFSRCGTGYFFFC